MRQIASDIKKQLGTITGDVKLKIDASAVKNVTQLNTALKTLNDNLTLTQTNATQAAAAISSFSAAAASVGRSTVSTSRNISSVTSATQKLTRTQNSFSKSAKASASEMEEFGKQSALAVRRFAAFSTATGAIVGFVGALRSGISAFIEFDKEFVKVQQVTGKTAAELFSLEKEITRLSVGLGVSSEELIKVSSTLAQAGLSAKDAQKALQALALTDLAPSFDSLNETVEGSIALMRQFGVSAGQLEQALGSVNAVAAAFAVESSDLIAAIQRTGGVFAAASRGVSEGTQALNEFLAIFTSVRQTTRESAETIATGLRTIFTRIQREDTIEALRQYGISLTDVEGKFVGAYKAVQLLSEGLGGLDPRDLRFSQIVEELGGFRQIGKVIPLIQQFSVAQEALGVAQRGQGSLASDAAVAQLALANQIKKVREEFTALMRSVGAGDAFQTLSRTALGFASSIIKVADSIKGVLPVLAILGLGAAARGASRFGTGFVAGLRKDKEDDGKGGFGGGGGGGLGSPMNSGPTRDLSILDDILKLNTQAIDSLSANITGLSASLGQINAFSAAIQANTASLTSNTASLDALTAIQLSNNSSLGDVATAVNSLSTFPTSIKDAVDTLYTTMIDLIVVTRELSNDIKNRPTGGSFNTGGVVKRFARGGVVPGSGDRDTVPAMLMPGEFVIRKKAVETIGADNLYNMNKYGAGGTIRAGLSGRRQKFISGGLVKDLLSSPYSKKALKTVYDIDVPYDEYSTPNIDRIDLDKTYNEYTEIAKKIWTQANAIYIKEKNSGYTDTKGIPPPKANEYIKSQTNGLSQNLGYKELRQPLSPRKLNKIRGSLAEKDVQKKYRLSSPLSLKEGADFYDEINDRYIEVKNQQQILKNETLISKALLAFGQKRNYKGNKIKDTVPSLNILGIESPSDDKYEEFYNFGGIVKKFMAGGKARPKTSKTLDMPDPPAGTSDELKSVIEESKSRGSSYALTVWRDAIKERLTSAYKGVLFPGLKPTEDKITPDTIISMYSENAGNYIKTSIKSLEADLDYIEKATGQKEGLVATKKYSISDMLDSIRAYQAFGLDSTINEYAAKKKLNTKLGSIISDEDKKKYAGLVDKPLSFFAGSLDSSMQFKMPEKLYAGLGASKQKLLLESAGISINDEKDIQKLKGKTVNMPAFLSSSDTEGVASTFSRTGMMTILTNKKRKGLDVNLAKQSTVNRDPKSQREAGNRLVFDDESGKFGEQFADDMDFESEFIFPRNSKFKVLNVKSSIWNKNKDPDQPWTIDWDVQQLAKGGEVFGTGETKFPKRITNAYAKELQKKIDQERVNNAFDPYPTNERITVDPAEVEQKFQSEPFDRQRFLSLFKTKISRNELVGNLSDFAKFIGLPSEDLTAVLPQTIDFGGQLQTMGYRGRFSRDPLGSQGYDDKGLEAFGFTTADEQDLFGYQKLLTEKEKEIKKILKTPVTTYEDGSFSYDSVAFNKAMDEKLDLGKKVSQIMDKRAIARKALSDQKKGLLESTGRGFVSISSNTFERNQPKNVLYHELTHQLLNSLRTKSEDSFTKYKERVSQLFSGDNDDLADAFDALGGSYNSADVVYGRSYKNGLLDYVLQDLRRGTISSGGRSPNPELSKEAYSMWVESDKKKNAREYRPINPKINDILLRGGQKQETLDRVEDYGKEEFLTTLIQNAPKLDSNMQGILDSTLNELLGNAGIQRQQYARGGKVTRNIGVIDTDILRDPANAEKVKEAMEALGITDTSDYSIKLGELAAQARKKEELDRFIAIAGAAGSGKSSLAMGMGANDDATLRKTTRFPILTPEDIKKADQVIALTATASQNKLDAFLKDTDKTYVLSSSTREEQEMVQKGRDTRDITGVGLYGRKPGSTRGASKDFGVEEVTLREELGAKAMVLGRQSEGYRLRRKKEEELAEIVQAKGYYTGGFSPATRGHAGAVEALLARMIEADPTASIKDILINAAGNLPMKSGEGIKHAARYGIFDSDLRLLMAKINFPGAMLAQGNSQTGEIPKYLEVLGQGARRKYAKVKGAMAITSGKDAGTLGKYERAGISVRDIPRIEDISATAVRTAMTEGDDKALASMVHPEIASILMGNRAQLRNRSEMVPMLLDSISVVVKAQEENINQQIQQMLAGLPGSPKVLSKKVKDEHPDIAEQVQNLRKQRDRLSEGALGYRAYGIINELAAKYPDMYAVDPNRRSQMSARITDVSSDVMAEQVRSAVQGSFGTAVPQHATTGLQEAILQQVAKTTKVDKSSGILPAKGGDILKRFGEERFPIDPKFGEFAGKSVRDSSVGGKLKYWNSSFPPATSPEKLAYYIAARDYLIEKFNESQGTQRAKALEETTNAVLASKQLGLVGLSPLGYTGLLGPETWNLGVDPSGQSRSIDASIIQRGLPTQYQNVIDYLSGKTEEIVGGASRLLGIEPKKLTKKQRETLGQGNIEGALLEQIFGSADATILDDALRTRPIDFPMGIGAKAAKIFGIDPDIPTEVKRTIDSGSRAKAVEEFQRYFRQQYGIPDPEKEVVKLAGGGSIQDTVPALLTPGEFVINKSAAQRIGYGKLEQLNKADKIQGFNKGGTVGVQKFLTGGTVGDAKYVEVQARIRRQSEKEFIRDLGKELKDRIIQLNTSTPKYIDEFRARVFQLQGRLTSTDTSDDAVAKKSDAKDELITMIRNIAGPSMDLTAGTDAIEQLMVNLGSMDFADAINATSSLTNAFTSATDSSNQYNRAIEELSIQTGLSIDGLKQGIFTLEASEKALNFEKIKNKADILSASFTKAALYVGTFGSLLSRIIDAPDSRSSRTSAAFTAEASTQIGQALAFGVQAIETTKAATSLAGGPGILGGIGSLATKALPFLTNPITASVAVVGTTLFGLAAGLKEASNAAREFDKMLANKNISNSLERVADLFSDFEKDNKDISVLDSINDKLNTAASNALSSIKIDTEVPKVFWLNLIDGLVGGNEAAARSMILERLGAGAYLQSSAYGQSPILMTLNATLLGLPDMLYTAIRGQSGFQRSMDVADQNRTIYMQSLLSDLAKSQSEQFKPVAESITKLFESRLRSGTNPQDIFASLQDPSGRASEFAESLARANPLVQQQILATEQSISLSDTEKRNRINLLILDEARYRTTLNVNRVLKELESIRLSNALQKFITSLERMFGNMDSAINSTTFSVSELGKASDASKEALTGNARSTEIGLQSINVLQNRRAYTLDEQNFAVDRASEMFGPAASVVKPLLNVGNKIEDTVLSTINKVIQNNPGASPEKIAGAVRASLNIAISDIGLPEGLTDKLSQQIQEAFAELRTQERDTNVSFDQLVEKVPALGKAVESARLAQEKAIKALEYWQKNVNDYASAVNSAMEAQIEAASRFRKAISIEVKGAMELSKALGKTISLTELKEASRAEIASQTGGITNPRDLLNNILSLEETRRTQQGLVNNAAEMGISGRDNLIVMQSRLRLTNQALKENYDALKSMAESGDMASAALSKISEAEQKRQAGVGLIEKMVGSAPEELASFQRALGRLNNNMRGIRNLNTTAQDRSESLQAFSMIAPLLGEQQNKLKANVLEGMLMESGIGIDAFANDIIESLRNPETNTEIQAAVEFYRDAIQLQSVANKSLGEISKLIAENSLKEAADRFAKSMEGVKLSFESQTLSDILVGINKLVTIAQGRGVVVPGGKALGGIVYAAAGQMIDFQPKGTDTVPAMLTPGEFVVNRRATQKNLPLLNKINNGVSYYATGGMVVDGIGPNVGKWTSDSYDPAKVDATRSDTQLETKGQYPIIKDLEAAKAYSKTDLDEYYSAPAKFYAINSTEGNVGDPFLNSATFGKSFKTDNLNAMPGIGYDKLTVKLGGEKYGGFGDKTYGEPASLDTRLLPAGYVPKNDGSLEAIIPAIDQFKNISKDQKAMYIDAYTNLIDQFKLAEPIHEKLKDTSPDMTRSKAKNYFKDFTKLKINGRAVSNTAAWLGYDEARVELGPLSYDAGGDSKFFFKNPSGATGSLNISSIKDTNLNGILGFNQRMSDLEWYSNIALFAGAGVRRILSLVGQRQGGGLWTEVVAGLPNMMPEMSRYLYNNVVGFQDLADIYGGPALQQSSRAIALKELYENNLKALKNDKEFQESELSLGNKSVVSKLEDLYYNRIFKASFGLELFKNRAADGIDLPLTLFNINKDKWKNIRSLNKRNEDKGKLFSWDDNDFIRINPKNNPLATKDMPWVSSNFDDFNLLNRMEASAGIVKTVQVAQGIYGKEGSGRFHIVYDKVKAPYFKSADATFDKIPKEYLVVSQIMQDRGLNPGSPLVDLPENSRLFYDGSIQSLVKLIEDSTPIIGPDGKPSNVVKPPPYNYDFDPPTAGLIPNYTNINDINRLLTSNEVYNTLGENQKYVVAMNRDNTLFLDPMTLVAEQFQNAALAKMQAEEKKKARELEVKVTGADSMKIDKKNGEEFTPAKRVTLARELYKKLDPMVGIGTGAPTNLASVKAIAVLLNRRLPEISKTAGKNSSEYSTVNAARSMFASMWEPKDTIAPYFKRMGVPIKDDAYGDPIPPPVDPTKPWRSPIDYYSKPPAGISGSLDLLIEREMDYWRSFSTTKLLTPENATRLTGIAQQFERNRITAEGDILPESAKDNIEIKGYQDIEKLALNPYNVPNKAKDRQLLLSELYDYYKTDVDQNGNAIWPDKRWKYIGDNAGGNVIRTPVTKSLPPNPPKHIREWYALQDSVLFGEQDAGGADTQYKAFIDSDSPDYIKDGVNIFNKYSAAAQKFNEYLTGNLYGNLPNFEYIGARLKSKSTSEEEPIEPVAKAEGGVVYASTGKYIDFKPRGTDTVPAMLTPGEFVVNRAATQRNLPLLKSINNGTTGYSKGGVIYAQNGMQVPGPSDFALTTSGAGMPSVQASKTRVETEMDAINLQKYFDKAKAHFEAEENKRNRIQFSMALIQEALKAYKNTPYDSTLNRWFDSKNPINILEDEQALLQQKLMYSLLGVDTNAGVWLARAELFSKQAGEIGVGFGGGALGGLAGGASGFGAATPVTGPAGGAAGYILAVEAYKDYMGEQYRERMDTLRQAFKYQAVGTDLAPAVLAIAQVGKSAITNVQNLRSAGAGQLVPGARTATAKVGQEVTGDLAGTVAATFATGEPINYTAQDAILAAFGIKLDSRLPGESSRNLPNTESKTTAAKIPPPPIPTTKTEMNKTSFLDFLKQMMARRQGSPESLFDATGKFMSTNFRPLIIKDLINHLFSPAKNAKSVARTAGYLSRLLGVPRELIMSKNMGLLFKDLKKEYAGTLQEGITDKVDLSTGVASGNPSLMTIDPAVADNTTVFHELGHSILKRLGRQGYERFLKYMSANKQKLIAYMSERPDIFRGYGIPDVFDGVHYVKRHVSRDNLWKFLTDPKNHYIFEERNLKNILMQRRAGIIGDYQVKIGQLTKDTPDMLDLGAWVEGLVDATGGKETNLGKVLPTVKKYQEFLEKGREMNPGNVPGVGEQFKAMERDFYALRILKDPKELSYALQYGREEFFTQMLQRFDILDETGLKIFSEILGEVWNDPRLSLFNKDYVYNNMKRVIGEDLIKRNNARRPPPLPGAAPVQNRANGGLIYASNGSLINFQPRGTDTVPAMLTPGEFVVNAQATKDNLGLLKNINAGYYAAGGQSGGVVYAQNGMLLRSQNKTQLTEDNFEAISQLYNTMKANRQDTAMRRRGSTNTPSPVNNFDSEKAGEQLSTLSTSLSTAGMIPVVGEAFDLMAAVIDILRGDFVGAGLSASSAIPFFGNLTGAANFGRKSTRLFPDIKSLMESRRKAKILYTDNRGALLPFDKQPQATQKLMSLEQYQETLNEYIKRPLSFMNPGRFRGDNTIFIMRGRGAANAKRHELLHMFSNDLNVPVQSGSLVDKARKIRGNNEAYSNKNNGLEDIWGEVKAIITEERAAFGTEKSSVITKALNSMGVPLVYGLEQAMRSLKWNKYLKSPAAKKIADEYRGALSEIMDDFDDLDDFDIKFPEFKNKGGLIYANNGMMIPYQPRGTDTVPAMLTPGEFVVNRQATQNNLSLLKAINSGSYSRGDIVKQFNKGGFVNPVYRQFGGAMPSQQSRNEGFNFKLLMQTVIGQLSTILTTSLNQALKPLNNIQNGLTNPNGVSIDSRSVDSIREFTNNLRNIANTLAGLSNIPSEIKITGRHEVSIVVNGDSVLNKLNPEIQQIVMNEMKNSFQKLVDANKPVPSDQLTNPFNLPDAQ